VLDAVLDKLDGGELTVAVCPERLQLVPCLHLCHELELLDGLCSLILGEQCAQPHVLAAVIDE
jgi:hypothetical protein